MQSELELPFSAFAEASLPHVASAPLPTGSASALMNFMFWATKGSPQMYLSLSVLDSQMVLDGSHTPQKTQREPRTKSPPLMGKTDFAELMKAQAQLMDTSNNSFIDKLGLLMASSDTMD